MAYQHVVPWGATVRPFFVYFNFQKFRRFGHQIIAILKRQWGYEDTDPVLLSFFSLRLAWNVALSFNTVLQAGALCHNLKPRDM